MTKLGLECNQSSSSAHSCKLLGCKPCTYPALRLQKEPSVSDRDINGLVDRGILSILSKVIDLAACRRWEGHGNSLRYSGGKEATIYRGN